MNIRSSVIPFLLPHVFKHSHGLKKMETDTTDNQAADFHNFLFIVDNLGGNHDSVGVVINVFLNSRIRLIGFLLFLTIISSDSLRKR